MRAGGTAERGETGQVARSGAVLFGMLSAGAGVHREAAMQRVLTAGVIGGSVLLGWSVLFHTFGPVEPGGLSASQFAGALRASLAQAGVPIPFGPSEAGAAGVDAPAMVAVAPLPFIELLKGLAVACAAATAAAMLMAWAGGDRKPFVERVIFAVLLGAFASTAMLVPGGGWSEFSVANAAPLVAEALVGWLLVGMVIAVALSPKPRARARA